MPKFKTRLGEDGYDYAYTSEELVFDENGNSIKEKINKIDEDKADKTEVLLREKLNDNGVGADEVWSANKTNSKFNEVAAQFQTVGQENKDIISMKNWEVQDKLKKVKPLITFVDDDGRREVLTKLLPLSETYNIPFVVAAIAKYFDTPDSRFMTKEQLLMLQNKGWEISGHTYSHEHLGQKTYDEQEYELKHSLDIFTQNELNVTTLCYPFSSYNDNTIEIAKKYYRCGRMTDSAGAINTVPLETWSIVSMPLGSYFDTWSNPPYPTNTLEYYKWNVDQCFEKNGWLVIMTHCSDAQHTSEQQLLLEETIKYIKQKNIEVVTLNEGLNRRGNIIDVGRYYKKDKTKEHFVVGCNGQYSGNYLQKLCFETPLGEISNTTPPNYFTEKGIYLSSIGSSKSEGFPNNASGNLLTIRINSNDISSGVITQQYRNYNKNVIYERYSLDNNSWTDWNISNMFIKKNTTQTNFNFDSKYTDFPNDTITKVLVPNIVGKTPVRYKSGVLTVDKTLNHEYYGYQVFEPEQSKDVYRRNWIPTSSTWGEWMLINPTSSTTANRNSVNFLKSIGMNVFDTDLGKPIWWNGTSWVDAMGTLV